jgi:hypothetical protein
MPKITGGKAHAARLKFLTSPEAMASVGRALFAGGEMIQVEAQISITRGAVSGKNHVPSAPGSPPNADTHRLSDNIETVQISADRVEVSSNAPYAAAQEFGNSKLPARPYMAPAAAAKRKDVTDLVRRAVAHVAKGGTIR